MILVLEPQASLALIRARSLPHAHQQGQEACGLLCGHSAANRIHVVRSVKVTNRSPQAGRFELCPNGWMRAERAARNLALQVIGVWHTHPNAAAVPSLSDLHDGWSDRPSVIVGRDGIRAWSRMGGSWTELQVHYCDEPAERV